MNTQTVVKKQQPSRPTQRQRIEIITMLAQVYNLDECRYDGGETDDTVADVLNMRPGWVSEIRDAEFGPAGGNEDMEALQGDITTAKEALGKEIKDAELRAKKLAELLQAVKEIEVKYGRIAKAVGARNLKKAGIK